MSTDDRTPDTREVRSMYGAGSNIFRETPEQHYLGHPAPGYGAEFDRFLARVRQDAARSALDGLAIDLAVTSGYTEAEEVRDWRDAHYPEEDQT